jgi:hypothetical protein
MLTALRFLDMRRAGVAAVLAMGKAGAWARYAKAMAPIDVAISTDAGSCPVSDEDFLNKLFVPGVQLVAEACE